MTFTDAARRYWLGAFPAARRELRHWRLRAAEIPDPELRRYALAAHVTKAAHSEGAAAFATLVPRAHRGAVVRAAVSFQALYDYLDTLSERPGPRRFANALQLHRALVVALDPGARHADYYALNPARDDGGYLEELVDACRAACTGLPSYGAVASTVQRAAKRAMESQGHNHAVEPSSPGVSSGAAARWAEGQAPPGSGLAWWELVGAAGSSLAILALLAAAAEPGLPRGDLQAIETLYFPWAGALLALLDSLVDQAEDAREESHSLVARYGSPKEAANRLGAIAERALELTGKVPHGRRHALIIAGMASLFLTAPEASDPRAREPMGRVLAELGDLATPAMTVLRIKRNLEACSNRKLLC